MSSSPINSNLNNLMPQTLKLQIRPPTTPHQPSFSQSLLDPLSDHNLNLCDSDSGSDSEINNVSLQTFIAKEEYRIENEIIRIINSGNAFSLMPNSGQSVTVCDHHICISFNQGMGSDYRVWEWHGHIMLFDEDGFKLEYIYGNYFEILPYMSLGMEATEEVEEEDEKEERVRNAGLRDLIDGGNSSRDRILHRNLNAVAPSL